MAVDLFTTTTGKTQGCAYLNGIIQMFYGASEPTTTWPFQNWGDTASNLWKQRNEANDAWINRGTLNAAYFGLVLQSYVDSKRQEDDPIGLIKPVLSTTATTNYLLCDGKTVGDGSSGATGRANDDTILLFNYIWTNLTDTTGPIYTSVGGASTRGASAAADWAAHKRITIPDMRGRTLVGMDNLGGTSANNITGTWADSLGATFGEENHTITVNEMPSHNHPGLGGAGYNGSAVNGLLSSQGSGFSASSTNVQSQGGGQSHNNVQPSMAIGYQMRYKY